MADRIDYIGPWMLNREERCWERWYREPRDLGLIHTHHVWLDDVLMLDAAHNGGTDG